MVEVGGVEPLPLSFTGPAKEGIYSIYQNGDATLEYKAFPGTLDVTYMYSIAGDFCGGYFRYGEPQNGQSTLYTFE